MQGYLSDGPYVADDGVGIPPDDREDVFSFGYSSTTGGSGLGLTIANDIVEAPGGTSR